MPNQFWELTPREVFSLAEGYQSRHDRQMEITAWHAANLMNIHLKKKVTAKKLLGKDHGVTMADREREFAKLKRALAERG